MGWPKSVAQLPSAGCVAPVLHRMRRDFPRAAVGVSVERVPFGGVDRFTGGVDVPSKYVFRGLVQETDSGLTLFPYGDLGIALFSGEGALKSASVNVGVWNALMTGSSGTDGPTEKLHYEEDFYTTLTLGFGAGVGLFVFVPLVNLLFMPAAVAGGVLFHAELERDRT